jgi:hypothetical protein
MQTTHRRIALLTGASVAALGAAAPTFAATVPGPAGHTITQAGDITDTLVICDIAPALPSSPCVYGVDNTGTGTVTSTVNSQPTGQIVQDLNSTAGSASGTITNNGAAEIHAIALATAPVAGLASADASISTGVFQSVSALETANAVFTIAGTTATTGTDASLLILASAVATGTNAVAGADVHGINQVAAATGVGFDAAATITNNGTLTVEAIASAFGTTAADADATVHGITQRAVAVGDVATVTLNNNGVINLLATAVASATSGGASADASVTGGIEQTATGATATAVFVNSGTVSLHAAATASASGFADADATANSGIDQDLNGTLVAGTVTNNGLIAIAASAVANGSGASAAANAASGIDQSADIAGGGTGTLSAVNSGTLSLSANATASATDGRADAEATATAGIVQAANGLGATANLSMANNGLVSLVANANATGATTAEADATATSAMHQSANNVAVYNATMTNAATLTASANAVAVAANDATTDSADADASASGMFQEVGSAVLTASLSMVNSGTVNVVANATASAQENVTAEADALGAGQELQATTVNSASFANSGAITVNANAIAVGTSGDADADATGYIATGFGGAAGTLTAINSGTMNVTAVAAAPGSADAFAGGMRALGVDGSVSLSNSGNLHVVASASGGTTSEATAIGMDAAFHNGVTTITNSGTLSVDAITAGNGDPIAAGIVVFTTGAPGVDDVTTINNSGDIIVRESVDGGTTWRRGSAIDVNPLGFPSSTPTVVNLLAGNIYGDIDINAGDEINVTDATTYFDGIINPDNMPIAGVTDLALDAGVAGDGALTISGGGNLILADPRNTGNPATYDGPAYAFVDTFTVATDGTITFELQPNADTTDVDGETQLVGTYPQVFANTATLEGTLVARILPPGGLFADSYFWDNVIDATTRVGGFDGAQCVLDSPLEGSVLLSGLDCIEDDSGNIDLAISRVPFDEVAGLNQNGLSAAEGLECLYNTSLTGPFATLVADLFRITDEGDFNTAMNMLAGESYAQYLQSFPSLGVHYNDIIAHATDCEVPALAGSVIECRASAPVHIWGQIDYQWRKVDGDDEAPGIKSKRMTGLIGVDGVIGGSAIVGASIGVVNNHIRDRFFADEVQGDGYLFGAYAAFDPGAFFVKGVATYASFDGDAERHIDLTPFGGTLVGSTRGDPDVKMWTVGLHGGARFPMGATSVITPYLNLDYVHAKMDAFIENTTTGAELHLDDNDANHSFFTGGVKWATQMGGVVPEVNLGYRHRFGNTRTNITEAFNCQIDLCPFDIVSSGEKRGTFLAGLSIGGKIGWADLRIGYEGEFNGDVKSHSGNFRIVVPIGGHAAPPPPPPPVERGERGQ